MHFVELFFWGSLFAGVLLLLFVEPLCLVVGAFVAGLFLVAIFMGFDDFLNYLLRFMAISSLGAMAVKIKARGVPVIFLLLTLSSMWMYLDVFNYFLFVVIFLVFAASLFLISMSIMVKFNLPIIFSRMQSMDVLIGKYYMSLTGVAIAWPFVIYFMKRWF